MGDSQLPRNFETDKQAFPDFADLHPQHGHGKKPAKLQTIDNFIGRSISLPASWRLADNNSGGLTMRTFSSPAKDGTLCLYDRGLDLPESTASAFNQLLADNASITQPKVLLPRQIRDVSEVMGAANAGDNQFTNNQAYPDVKSPVFHLGSAQLIPLNGRVALEVEGHYVDQNGSAGQYFRGIFIPAENDRARVKEFFLQANTLEGFARHEKDYQKTLKTIKW